MTTPQIVARVQVEHATRTAQRLSLPGEHSRLATFAVLAFLVLGLVAALFISCAVAGAI